MAFWFNTHKWFMPRQRFKNLISIYKRQQYIKKHTGYLIRGHTKISKQLRDYEYGAYK